MPRLRPPQGRSAAGAIDKKFEEEEVQPEVQEPEVEEVEVQEDPTIALKKQIEDLKKSNQEAIDRATQAEEARLSAIKQAQERETEVGKLKEQTSNSQLEAIEAALGGAQSDAEAAQQEIEMAAQLGDMAAQSKAYRKLARAEANILSLENGKEALERQIKETPKPEPAKATQDALENVDLPPRAKTWLRAHPEYLYDARKNARIQALHWDVIDQGHQPYSASYFETMEQHLGLREAPAMEQEVEEEVPAPRKQVSAPPSRQVPNSSGKRSDSRITLSAEQKKAAKMAGITEEEYAKGLIKLNEEKANGNYGGGQ